MTYAEYLKANGATDDDVKLLATPLASKLWDKQQADLTAATAAAAKASEQAAAYQRWHDEQAAPYVAKIEKERDSARIEAAAAAARLKAAQDAGLIELAEQREPGSSVTPPPTPTFDPKAHNLVTTDILTQVAEKEGDAIAMAQDIAAEHSILFPGQRLNFRELRKQAVTERKSLEQVWMDKYGVAAARTAKETADKAAYEEKVGKAAVDKWRAEHPTTNPLMGVPVVSSTPFTGKVPSATDAPLPWNQSDTERVNSRLARFSAKHPEIMQ